VYLFISNTFYLQVVSIIVYLCVISTDTFKSVEQKKSYPSDEENLKTILPGAISSQKGV